ncbi:MAG: signal recognition particle protein [Defluviitaleaceae bacterium]|nr:signal recognition particle protein [Defluviitaleaceae bacterium]MCL2262935.1 signal recognition particle protein [Defluviitaleaceae bacterium]
MAFESLGEKLQDVFKKLRGKGKLAEGDVKEAMREVRLALLEADVNFRVVKDFVASITEKAVGHEILESLNPGQQVIKLVHEEMIALMGSTQSQLTFSSKPPTVYMMVGLQGAGKTTSSGKLAGLMRKQGKRPLLVACDVYRPAAIKQLQVVGSTYNIPVFEMGDKASPVTIAEKSLEFANENGHDIVLIDTAGRLHIDDTLMDELGDIRAKVKPQEILLVVDAMTGQDAVNVAKTFDEKLGLDGIIVTKLDSDTRGGAVLSVKKVTGKPVKYIGMGEKLDDMEPFHPDRMASRILGMGDVLSLIDKAQQAFDEKQAADLEKKFRENSLDLEDFLQQMQQIKKMGNIKDLLGMMPGVNQAALAGAEIDEKAMVHMEAIIQSMTKKERQNPEILNGSRKRRIAAGSGRTIQEVNRLLKQFEEMRKMLKGFSGMMGKGGKKGKGLLGKMGKLPFFG